MKPTIEQLPAFINGVIYAFDECMQINDDKDLQWTIGNTQGKTQTMTVVTFTWVSCWTAEDEEPHFDEECLYLDGSETPAKIVRDIQDIMERINDAELQTMSVKEFLADNYFED